MRTPRLLLAIILPVAIAGCTATTETSSPNTEFSLKPGNELKDARGMVYQLSPGSEMFVILPDSDPTFRLVPSEFPEALRKDSLRVVFSGVVEEIPPNVRMIGTPLRVSRIERE